MAITSLEVSGYRSLKSIELPFGQLNVVTGPNGSGKSNLYRSLWLLSRICEGQFARTIAREGSFLSVMWAGPRASAKKPVRMSLGFSIDELHFRLTCGFPEPRLSYFRYDPEIKEEVVWIGRKQTRSNTLLERKAGLTWFRDVDGHRVEYPLSLSENESVLSQLREPHRFPELFMLREQVRNWRFYHSFRTDENAPLRTPQISVRTPVLSHDGSDLAAALQSIIEMGREQELHEIISEAFPGRELTILSNEPDFSQKTPRSTELGVAFLVDDSLRPFVARELSDGTLKFLCLAAALLTPRPPGLIALNEPESSLHPDLIVPLAKLIVQASELSQIWVSTHSAELASQIQQLTEIATIKLQLKEGQTIISDPADLWGEN